MNHQMYEEWALSPETCSPIEAEALARHRLECKSCDRLARNWQKLEQNLETYPLASPSSGFAQRFQQSLAARKAAEQKRQVRHFLLLLGGIFFVILLAGSIYFSSTTHPAAFLRQVFHMGAEILVTLENVKVITSTLLGFTPGAVFLPIVMVAASALGGFTLLWFTAIWKFTLHGEKAL